MVQASWQQAKILPPTIVVISYGPTWLLVPKGKTLDSGLLEDFMAKPPDIDKKTGTSKRRLLLGESMGGLNVLIAGLTYPQTVAKIASLCPGVYAISPFASLSAMNGTLKRTGADPKIGFGVWLLAKKHVADDSEWKRTCGALLGFLKSHSRVSAYEPAPSNPMLQHPPHIHPRF
jgi:pimeloyl-ACP methyl ester carboxylesterase